jgi:NAD(P)-dependent dehydrogenase (short-subunit alcohol dehydrogenase family)
MNHVLITGGTGFIGKEIVKGFISKNYKVTFTTTNKKNGEIFVKKLNSPDFLNFIVVKFNSEKNTKTFIDNCIKYNFTHLINNARSLDGLSVDKNGHANEESFRSEFFMAVTLPYLLTIGFKGSLISIVNISSMYGIVPPNKHLYTNGYETSPIQYGIAKSAQIHLSKELSVRLSDEGIRVNSVSFGGIEGRVDNEFIERYSKLCPLGRMLKNSELFNPIWFAASEESSGMTGHNLVVDGGWSVW